MLGGDNKKEETRNLILAAVLSMAVVFIWYAVFPPPEPAPVQEPAAGQTPAPDGSIAGTADGVAIPLDRDGALARTDRVAVENDAVYGSISLKGGRLDDLHLSEYRETLEPGSDTVVLLNPTGGPTPYYATYGWLPTQGGYNGPLPDPNTPWTVESGDTLTPESPITLVWDNGDGLIFRRTYALDERYMFRVTQAVENTRDEPVSIAPYGYLARRGTPDTIGFFILHEGVVAMIDGTLSEIDYDEMLEMQPALNEDGRAESALVQTNGWLGFTDKYWMTTMVPSPGTQFTAVYRALGGPTSGIAGPTEYRTEMRLPVTTIAPGETGSTETRLFAGAKELRTIRGYEDALLIENFEDSIDWGWFFFLTKPVASLLVFIQGIVGNMGFSIIIMTVIVKTLLFPLAYKSYVAMSKVKKLQPEMEKIKERVGDDRMKLQQEMMALYKREGANPAAGCLPILIQIPIFFSLYKVLFVTIEMRHAPFIGWIEDLAAPDPTSWLNLFGLLPYDVSWAPVFISIGLFPVLMGITMWMQQKLNPAPTDPTQAMVFAWLPFVFMFMLGSFEAGLVIYWTANNILTFAQQYAIMRSQGVDVDFFGNVTRSFKKKREEPAAAGAAGGTTAQQPAAVTLDKRRDDADADTDTGTDAGTDTGPDTGPNSGTPAGSDGAQDGPAGDDDARGSGAGNDGRRGRQQRRGTPKRGKRRR